MPKDTFFNLPEEKQKLIEEAAIDEFAEYSYENTSINRIVDRCSIAKGSFYQYFADKKDLYLHVMMLIGQEKVKYMTPILQNPEEHDFFTLIKEVYISGMKFAVSNSKLAGIGIQMLKNIGNSIYNELIDENMPTAYSIYENMLLLAIKRGEIRDDIDVKYISYMMTYMSISNFEYWLKNSKNKGYDFAEHTEEILDLVDKQLDFIKSGIGK